MTQDMMTSARAFGEELRRRSALREMIPSRPSGLPALEVEGLTGAVARRALGGSYHRTSPTATATGPGRREGRHGGELKIADQLRPKGPKLLPGLLELADGWPRTTLAAVIYMEAYIKEGVDPKSHSTNLVARLHAGCPASRKSQRRRQALRQREPTIRSTASSAPILLEGELALSVAGCDSHVRGA